MTPQDIKELIPILAQYKVNSFKNGGVEILFHVEQSQHASKDGNDKVSSPRLAEHIEHTPDLRTDPVNAYDSVLYHSASPDPNEPTLPGTGEEGL